MLRTLGLCLSSILIIAWLNLSNDYFDSLTGVDTHKYESWVNITRSPRTIFVTAHASLLAGAGMLFWLLSQVRCSSLNARRGCSGQQGAARSLWGAQSGRP